MEGEEREEQRILGEKTVKIEVNSQGNQHTFKMTDSPF